MQEPSLTELFDLITYRYQHRRPVTCARLAQTLMYRDNGASRMTDVIPVSIDEPVTDSCCALLQALFRADNARAARDRLPLGVSITDVDFHRPADRGCHVLRAVAGCSHLVLSSLHMLGPIRGLLAALSVHQSLRYLAVSDYPILLSELMQTVSSTCRHLETLDIHVIKSHADPDALANVARILHSIASIETLRALVLMLDQPPADHAAFAPVMLLPRLSALHLCKLQQVQTSLALILAVLAQRSTPIHALLFSPRSGANAPAFLSLHPSVLQVLRPLSWLRVDLDASPELFDLFVNQALPVMTKLQRLEVFSTLASGPAPWMRILNTVPRRVNQPFTLLFNQQTITMQQSVSLRDFALTSDPGPQALHEVTLLTEGQLPDGLSEQRLLAVCRSVLPGLTKLAVLDVEPVLTGVMADALGDALPLLPRLAELTVRPDADDVSCRHSLRRLFSCFPPFSLAYLELVYPRGRRLVVPIQVLRAAMSVGVFGGEVDDRQCQARRSVYYVLPEHSRLPSPVPSLVPSLLSLCAHAVLTLVSPGHDLGCLPEELTFSSLCARTIPCDQCGLYRFPADMVPCVRRRPMDPSIIIEVLRCAACTLRQPATPLRM